MKLKSVPEDNKANKELIDFLAERLKVPKRSVEIISGHRQKRKTIAVIGLDTRTILQYIHANL